MSRRIHQSRKRFPSCTTYIHPGVIVLTVTLCHSAQTERLCVSAYCCRLAELNCLLALSSLSAPFSLNHFLPVASLLSNVMRLLRCCSSSARYLPSYTILFYGSAHDWMLSALFTLFFLYFVLFFFFFQPFFILYIIPGKQK